MTNATIANSVNTSVTHQGSGVYRIDKNGGTDGSYDASANQTSGGFSGDFYLRIGFNTTPNSGTQLGAVGVNTDPTTDNNYTSIDFAAIYLHGTGWFWNEPANGGGSLGSHNTYYWIARVSGTLTYGTGPTFSGRTIHRTVNGVTGTFYFDSSIQSAAALTDVIMSDTVPDTTAPTFTNSATVSVAENTVNPSGTLTLNEAATVAVNSGPDAADFSISQPGAPSTSATWTLNLTPDYESDTQYQVWFQATDAAGNTGFQFFTVNITDVTEGSVGAASGSGSATGQGRAVKPTQGAASGAGATSAQGSNLWHGNGAAAGTGTATGVGASTASATGAAAETGNAAAVSEVTIAASGAASGTGNAAGAGTAIKPVQGAAPGTGAATGQGVTVVASVGAASGTGTATGQGRATTSAVGAAPGTGTAPGQGRGLAHSVGAAPGTGNATGQGRSTASSAGAASGAGTASGAGGAFARYQPSSDVAAGGWFGSGGGALYADVDESPASDADYIYTSALNQPCSLGLPPVVDAGTDTGFRLLYRAASQNGTESLTVRLKQGATTIASETRTNVPTTETDYALVVSGAEAANITDFSALRVELEYA